MTLNRLLCACALGAAIAAAAGGASAQDAARTPDGLFGRDFLSAPIDGDSSPARPPPAPGQGAALSPDTVSSIVRIERYLNGLDTLRSRFVQVSSNGQYAEGELLVDRPGKLRFEYDPPVPILMIADGSFLLYYDKELEQSTFIPLWETPLWFLVSRDIRLSDGVEVLDLVEREGTLAVTLRDRELADLGTVTLVFSARPLTLRKWQVVDAQGIVIQVALVDPRFGVEVDRKAFDYGDLKIYRRKGEEGIFR